MFAEKALVALGRPTPSNSTRQSKYLTLYGSYGVQVGGRRRGRLERGVLEAALIHDCDYDSCISVAFVHLMKKEYDFIKRD